MQKLRVGLNGFGRIGRAFARIALEKNNITIPAINTAHSKPDMLAYLLQYDSVYRTYSKKVRAKADGFIVADQAVTTYNETDPGKIPWEKHHVDVVIDCTGVFKKRDDLKKHLQGGVRKVILTAPTSDETIPHIVLGANDDSFDFNADILSNASCTTNCAAVMTRVLDDHFKIVSGFLTTVHAYTSSQQLLDNTSSKHTRARAATLSIIPTTTGAAQAICQTTKCEPEQLGAVALRIPVPVGSISDMSVNVANKTSVDQIHAAFKKEAEGRLKGILAYEETPLVSADYIGSPYSCVYDANYTQVIGGNFIKIFGWYDNEWGYSSRLVDLVEKLGQYI